MYSLLLATALVAGGAQGWGEFDGGYGNYGGNYGDYRGGYGYGNYGYGAPPSGAYGCSGYGRNSAFARSNYNPFVTEDYQTSPFNYNLPNDPGSGYNYPYNQSGGYNYPNNQPGVYNYYPYNQPYGVTNPQYGTGPYGGPGYGTPGSYGSPGGYGYGNFYGNRPYAPLPSPTPPPPLAPNSPPPPPYGPPPPKGVYLFPTGGMGGVPTQPTILMSRNNSIPSDAARVTVILPENARLFVNNEINTERTPHVRLFVTPSLRPGTDYFYVMRIEVPRDGRVYTQTRQVDVRAGQLTTVDFLADAR